MDEKRLIELTEEEQAALNPGMLEKARGGDALAIMAINSQVLSRRRDACHKGEKKDCDLVRKEESAAIVKQEKKRAAQTQKQKEIPMTPYEQMQVENFAQTGHLLAKNKSRIPNIVVQTKIFEVTKPGRRKFYQDWVDVETTRDGVQIQQKFAQLNQLDLTGWLLLLKYAGNDMIAAFSNYEFLKSLKKQGSSKDYQWLTLFLDRIGTTQFAVYKHSKNPDERERFRGPLAPISYERGDGLNAVQLYRPLAAFLGLDGWSYINIEERLALGKAEWAQAFHAYLSTQVCPEKGFWWKKSDLYSWWGSDYKEQRVFLKMFRSRILKPLTEIGFVKRVAEKDTALGLWW